MSSSLVISDGDAAALVARDMDSIFSISLILCRAWFTCKCKGKYASRYRISYAGVKEFSKAVNIVLGRRSHPSIDIPSYPPLS